MKLVKSIILLTGVVIILSCTTTKMKFDYSKIEKAEISITMGLKKRCKYFVDYANRKNVYECVNKRGESCKATENLISDSLMKDIYNCFQTSKKRSFKYHDLDADLMWIVLVSNSGEKDSIEFLNYDADPEYNPLRKSNPSAYKIVNRLKSCQW